MAMKLRKDLKLFALVGKGWVEIRAARKPPVPHVSTCRHPLTDLVRVSEDPWSPGYHRWLDHITIRSTNWKGGRPLGSMRSGSFRELVQRGGIRRDTLLAYNQDSPTGRRIMRYLNDHHPL